MLQNFQDLETDNSAKRVKALKENGDLVERSVESIINEAIQLSDATIYTVAPNTSLSGNVANTGITYDTTRNEYLTAYYDIDNASEIWVFKPQNLVPFTTLGTLSPTPDSIIDVSSLLYRIQGIAYDEEDDTIWVLGQAGPGSSSVTNILVHIEYDGTLISSTNLNSITGLSNFSNGTIAVDYGRNELLYKPQDSVNLYYIDRTDLTVNGTQATFTSNEVMGFDHLTDEVWLVDFNGKMEIRNRGNWALMYETFFMTTSEGADQVNEQIVFVGDKVVISVDSFYHGNRNNGNTIWVFDRMPFYTNGNANSAERIARKSSVSTSFTTLYDSLPEGSHFYTISGGGSSGFPTTSGYFVLHKRITAGNNADFAFFSPNNTTDKAYMNVKTGTGTWGGWKLISTEPWVTANFQALLVSGTNIKTVGGVSLLGSGNVTEVQNSMTTSTTLAPSVAAVLSALAGKYDIPTGNDAQYVRGSGNLGTFSTSVRQVTIVSGTYTPAPGIVTGDDTTATALQKIDGKVIANNSYAAKTANYTYTDNDSVIDLTANSATFTLPTAVGRTGKRFTAKNSGSGTTLTLATTSSQTIDGTTTKTFNTQYSGCTVVSDGANWKITSLF